jgi:rsbT antagonist protein RsbS
MNHDNNSKTDTPIPVIELYGKLLLPLVGDITDTQMDALVEATLERIQARGSDGLVIDASGVWMVDSHLCAALGKLASSARLMGAEAVLCGLGSEVVITLQSMGFDLREVHTALGLEDALETLGLRLARSET